MPSKYQRHKNFERNTRLIEAFCDENKIESEAFNNGYQIRLEGMIDLYPVRARWHNIKTGERGDWNGYKDLRRVMLVALEMIARPKGKIGKVDVVEVDNIPEQDTYLMTQFSKTIFTVRLGKFKLTITEIKKALGK
jgi:hypothetical protein